MHLGNLGKQVFIRSRDAFRKLSFSGSESVSASKWYEQKLSRDLAARNNYHKLNKEAYVRGDLYMIRIIDEEVKADDPRLQ